MENIVNNIHKIRTIVIAGLGIVLLMDAIVWAILVLVEG